MKTLKCEEVYRAEYRNQAEARLRIVSNCQSRRIPIFWYLILAQILRLLSRHFRCARAALVI